MKPIKDRIKENQDFFNGVSVGVAIGVVGSMILVSRGIVVSAPTSVGRYP